jgi:hypothetical protein
LQQSTIFIKVENNADDPSEEGSIGERIDEDYIASSPCIIKAEPEVRHIFRCLIGVVVNMYGFMHIITVFEGGYK